VKKLTVLILISILLAGAVYGQGIRDNQRAGDTQRRTERQRGNDLVTIEGTLKLERGSVAVESGDSVYYVPTLNRYIGFINDLREGTRVSVEGREFRNVIQPTKVTIGGRSYDFPASGPNSGFGMQGFNRLQENEPGRGQLQSRNNPGPGYRNFNTPGRRYGSGRGGCCW